MESASPENCQICFRPVPPEGFQPKSQWKSFCRCSRTYSPKSQFSIDVCANCKRRIASNADDIINTAWLCSCSTPNAKTVPNYIKPNENDAATLDLASIKVPAGSFPVEKFAPIGMLGDSPRATVILCRDKTRGTKVAVKCFKTITVAQKPVFESEMRKNKELNHTSIAKVIEFGFHNGTSPYVVTEYKDGFNLEQCLAIEGPPSADVAVKILLGVCEALLYAQRQMVLHRDIRPGNIIFLDDNNSEPSICVLDFALPKIKESQEVTDADQALYITADEARRIDYTEKSEIYGLGTVGFALLTGRPPFQGGVALDIKNSHALKLPPRINDLKFDPSRPGDLPEVIEKCLEKDPRVRFESVQQFADRLQIFPRREQMKIAAVKAEKTRKTVLIAFAVLFGILVVVGGVLMALGHH